MSARPDEALTRWLERQTARAGELAAAHETIVDVAIAVLIAATSFVGLAIQDRLRHPGTIVFCIALCAPLTIRGAAAIIGCSTWTIRQKYLPMGLPHFRVRGTGKFTFYKNQITRWLLAQQEKGGMI